MKDAADRAALDLAAIAVLRDFASKIADGVFVVLELDASDSPDSVGVRVTLAEPEKIGEAAADPSVDGFVCPNCSNADLRRLTVHDDGAIGCMACKTEFKRSD